MAASYLSYRPGSLFNFLPNCCNLTQANYSLLRSLSCVPGFQGSATLYLSSTILRFSRNFSNTRSLSFSLQEWNIPMDSSSQKAWIFLSKTSTQRSWCATTESEKSCPPCAEPYNIHPDTVDWAANKLSGTVMMLGLTNFQYASRPITISTFILSTVLWSSTNCKSPKQEVSYGGTTGRRSGAQITGTSFAWSEWLEPELSSSTTLNIWHSSFTLGLPLPNAQYECGWVSTHSGLTLQTRSVVM